MAEAAVRRVGVLLNGFGATTRQKSGCVWLVGLDALRGDSARTCVRGTYHPCTPGGFADRRLTVLRLRA